MARYPMNATREDVEEIRRQRGREERERNRELSRQLALEDAAREEKLRKLDAP